MRIFLIRHGRQSDIRCNVDVGLSAEGRRQADLAGRRMADWGIEQLYSSDMVRARETAEIAGRHLQLEPTIIPDLRELDFGDMTGLTDEQIAEQFADFQRRQARMDEDLAYPGGESIGALLERVMPALATVTAGDHGTVAVATHGVVIRALLAQILGAPLPRWRLTSTTLENGSLTEISWDPETEEFAVQRVNDFAHIEAHPELLRSAWGVREN